MVLKEEITQDITPSIEVQELINVRLNSDKIEIEKRSAVGYHCTLDFKEVFYE